MNAKNLLVIMAVIFIGALALTLAGSMVLSESEQAAWNAHCLRDNGNEQDVLACQSAYVPGIYGK